MYSCIYISQISLISLTAATNSHVFQPRNFRPCHVVHSRVFGRPFRTPIDSIVSCFRFRHYFCTVYEIWRVSGRKPGFTYHTLVRLQIRQSYHWGHSKNMSRLKGREGVRWGVTKCDRGGEGVLQHVLSRLWKIFITLFMVINKPVRLWLATTDWVTYSHY